MQPRFECDEDFLMGCISEVKQLVKQKDIVGACRVIQQMKANGGADCIEVRAATEILGSVKP